MPFHFLYSLYYLLTSFIILYKSGFVGTEGEIPRGKFYAMYNITLQKLPAECIAKPKGLKVSSTHFKPG